jgi:hypothetical protein
MLHLHGGHPFLVSVFQGIQGVCDAVVIVGRRDVVGASTSDMSIPVAVQKVGLLMAYRRPRG